MDNSGNDTLKAPGFGGIPIYHQLKSSAVFTHGAGGTEAYGFWESLEQPQWSSWAHCLRLTAREISMIRLMNSITDKEHWNVNIFDEYLVSRWRLEASQIRLLSHKAWEWCLVELMDKAQLLNDGQKNHVVILDTGSCVCKSDTLLDSGLQDELQQYSKILHQHTVPEPVCGLTPLIDPSLFPLALGKTSVLLGGGQVNLGNILESYGQGVTSPSHRPHPVSPYQGRGQSKRDFPFNDAHEEISMFRFSPKFQWLPCEVEFEDDANKGTDVMVKITSYINNLHPGQYRGLYRVLEKLISFSIKPWNDCLIFAQRPRVPPRIITFGVRPNDVEHPEPGTSFTYQDWMEGKTKNTIVPPSPLFLKYTPHMGKNHEFYHVALEQTFREQGLQIVVQMSDIELTPDLPNFPGTPWHVSGLLNDHIVATSVHFYDVENISEARISFRQETSFDQRDYLWTSNQLEIMADVFDIDVSGLKDDEIPLMDACAEGTQELGSVHTFQGRTIAWPNALQHRIEPFQLQDPSQKGHIRSVTLHLVDPHYRVCSTRNVPPQRHDWWAESVITDLMKLGLPAEVARLILSYTDTWPMGIEEAKSTKQELEKEHDWAREAMEGIGDEWWGLMFSGQLEPWRTS